MRALKIGDEALVGQMEIAPALPAVVEILDRPAALVLHEAALLAAAALEAGDEMGAEFRLENMRQDEDRRRRGRPEGLARRRRAAQMRQHPIGLVQGGDVDDPQHRVEDDQDRSAPKARAISSPSHKKTIEGNRA